MIGRNRFVAKNLDYFIIVVIDIKFNLKYYFKTDSFDGLVVDLSIIAVTIDWKCYWSLTIAF